MIQMGLDAFLHKVAAGLGVSDAANDALTFVRLSGVEALLDRPTAYSDVAPGPVPLELSFSQARAADLRLLAEPCVPGEGILARTVMGIEAVYEVTAAMFSPELAVQTRDLVRSLLPDGEEVAHLNWRSSIWLALRTTGGPPAVRIYVNAQFRDAEDRWFRIGRALSSFGFRECGDDLKRLRGAAGELVEPIGMCFDVRLSGLIPARVHCVTYRISPFWLLRLLAATGNEAATGDVADFLELFDLLERTGECPILVSLGLGKGEVSSLKIDVDVPNLYRDNGASRVPHLAHAEARFGRIDAYHRVGWMLDEAQPRYIGITITPAVRFLNVYFPCAFQPCKDRPYAATVALEKARTFVHGQLENAGALLMDARSSCAARAVPPSWPDLYMTCLLIQECSPSLGLGRDVLERARSYVLAAREDWYWRYLPDLPGDLDDTAMAWLALDVTQGHIDDVVLQRVMATANPDGGFRTFIGDPGENQPSHPAVTVNITYALDQAKAGWSPVDSDRYLQQWLQQPGFPTCAWIGSHLFPIFLFRRATGLIERLGASARKRMVARVLEMQRADGSWGSSLPDGLDTALAVLTLDLLGAHVANRGTLRRLLLTLQLDDGGWGWSPLYSDGSGTWFGHRAITTMFAIGALEILNGAPQSGEDT